MTNDIILGKEAHCVDCGSEVYVAEVNDFNLKALYDVYIEKNNIVSLDVILAIPEKYVIGKRPLSLLLGWGEQTFSRYCDGDMPTKQYSEILQKLYDNPSYYAEILESNKGNLKTTAFYEKSKRAVNELLGRTGSTKTKIDQTIEYLLMECEAWVHGPVYREIYFRYRDYQFDPIEGNNEFDDSVFYSSEKAILDSVIKNICCYSGKVLETFTHSETPWLSTRGELPLKALSDRVIQKKQIGEYFSAVKEKYNMINPNDIKEYTQNMFEQM